MQCSVDFHDAIIRFNGRSSRAALMPHATQRDVSLRDSPITTPASTQGVPEFRASPSPRTYGKCHVSRSTRGRLCRGLR
jgi:hypothetical protein